MLKLPSLKILSITVSWRNLLYLAHGSYFCFHLGLKTPMKQHSTWMKPAAHMGKTTEFPPHTTSNIQVLQCWRTWPWFIPIKNNTKGSGTSFVTTSSGYYNIKVSNWLNTEPNYWQMIGIIFQANLWIVSIQI